MEPEFVGYNETLLAEKFLVKSNTYSVQLMTKFAKGRDKVLDFGAGIGSLTTIWEKLTKVKPDCLEIDPFQAEQLKKRGFNCFLSLDDVNQKYDLIYSSDVLEHIEDDVAIIKRLYDLLNPGGLIILYLPALMSIYSEYDKSVGHYRRYEKKELIEKVKLGGFEVINCQFANSIGYFASLYMRIFGYKNKEMSNSGSGFKFYDKWVVPVNKLFDKLGLKHFFGKNLLIIGKKP